jgi:hypothetical protein
MLRSLGETTTPSAMTRALTVQGGDCETAPTCLLSEPVEHDSQHRDTQDADVGQPGVASEVLERGKVPDRSLDE